MPFTFNVQPIKFPREHFQNDPCPIRIVDIEHEVCASLDGFVSFLVNVQGAKNGREFQQNLF